VHRGRLETEIVDQAARRASVASSFWECRNLENHNSVHLHVVILNMSLCLRRPLSIVVDIHNNTLYTCSLKLAL